jgi:hypothetical protein
MDPDWEAAWSGFWRRRKRYNLSLALWLPALVLVLLSAPPKGVDATPVVTPLLLIGLGVIVAVAAVTMWTMFAIMRFRCPRCAQLFCSLGSSRSDFSTKECLHCHLRVGELPSTALYPW